MGIESAGHGVPGEREEHLADVVAMMTGIPVNKIAESESQKLLKMDTVLRTSDHRSG
jgi:ATP-dependent Clp protease ATP-binding subunit ClpA